MSSSPQFAGAEEMNAIDFARELAALGPKWNSEILAATNALYAERVETAATGVERIPDLAYGQHPRQRLDAYVPQHENPPVLLFLPGGGFTGGGKDEHPSFYRNFGTYFAKNGFLTFIANYRLAPEFKWPEQTSDAGSAIEWVGSNAHQYGSRRGYVSLVGHSAGAVNLAGYLLHPGYGERPQRPDVRHVVLVSGAYHFTDDSPPNVQMYAGERASWSDRSPLTHIQRCDFSLALLAGELDPEQLVRPTLELAAAFARAKGHCPPVHVLGGHNHVSTMRSIGSSDDTVGRLVLSLVQ